MPCNDPIPPSVMDYLVSLIGLWYAPYFSLLKYSRNTDVILTIVNHVEI